MKGLTMSAEKYGKLKKKYEESVEKNKDIFMFEGNEILTSYAKYLLEFLKSKFDENTN